MIWSGAMGEGHVRMMAAMREEQETAFHTEYLDR